MEVDMNLWNEHEPDPFRLVPWRETWREIRSRRQGPRPGASDEGARPSGADRDSSLPDRERRLPVRRDRGPTAAGAGDGVATPQGPEERGADSRHHRSAA